MVAFVEITEAYANSPPRARGQDRRHSFGDSPRGQPNESIALRSTSYAGHADWALACRAGTSTAYFFGDTPNKLGLYAWFYGNRRPENPELVAHPVGQLLPNDWGIYDMLGNVEEWCVDVWDEEYEGGEDPVCAPIGDPSRELYIQRGGHFEAGRAHCRSASRGFSSPEAGGEYAGFRIVLIEDVR